MQFRCRQPSSEDYRHHDKSPHRAACHNCLDGGATRDLRIAGADRATGRGSGQGRGRQSQGAAEGRSAPRCRAQGAGRSAARRSATTTARPTAGRGTSAPRAAAAGCCSATARPAAATASPGRASGSATSAPCRGSAAAPDASASGGHSAAPAPAAASHGSTARTHAASAGGDSAKATCCTDPAASTFDSEGGAISRSDTASAIGLEAIAGADHDARPAPGAAGRQYDDTPARRNHNGAGAAGRRAGDASRRWHNDDSANRAAGPSRRPSWRAATGCVGRDTSGADAECRRSCHRSGDNPARNRSSGANRRARHARRGAAARSRPKRTADHRTGVPPGTSGHGTAAAGSSISGRIEGDQRGRTAYGAASP